MFQNLFYLNNDGAYQERYTPVNPGECNSIRWAR